MGFFLHIKSLPNLLLGVLCLPGDQSHPFAQPTINPLSCCICWAALLGSAVFPPWNEGPNFGSYSFDYMDLCPQNDVSAFLYAVKVDKFFFQGASLLISWLQSSTVVILDPKDIQSVTVCTFSPSICH